ncbi:MAG: hypothetical protein PHR43_00125 [Dehalococcoidales bacterium]|nr:hypothetical protein [Dehalococcoidales bacterium]
MEETMVQQNEVKETKEVKKKKGFWGKFATFLMMGGWILILIVVMGIIIAVSAATGG